MSIEKLAKEAGYTCAQGSYEMKYSGGSLEKFADLVRAETKEECANVCDGGIDQVRENGWIDAANERARCAVAIRAIK